MKLSRRQLAKVVAGYIEKSPTSAAKKVAAYLIESRRVSELDAIMREVAAIMQQKSGVVEITATSAFPLSNAVKREVAKAFNASKVHFAENIDKSVLGGARFESLDKRLDLTIERKLNTLRTK